MAFFSRVFLRYALSKPFLACYLTYSSVIIRQCDCVSRETPIALGLGLFWLVTGLRRRIILIVLHLVCS
ncbi:hypothetical protein AXFE_19930 [Acidithrix ferrooxidans]|uniref:Uncharacterized protein n=1 Tax=Acidithrix ferrooxidans TaxID=1280514 RepID=A0A0D8HHC2_9ACTN|nr:hypothetical protein AXFE_19930 [Acidithrix ferrooxidans]